MDIRKGALFGAFLSIGVGAAIALQKAVAAIFAKTDNVSKWSHASAKNAEDDKEGACYELVKKKRNKDSRTVSTIAKLIVLGEGQHKFANRHNADIQGGVAMQDSNQSASTRSTVTLKSVVLDTKYDAQTVHEENIATAFAVALVDGARSMQTEESSSKETLDSENGIDSSKDFAWETQDNRPRVQQGTEESAIVYSASENQTERNDGRSSSSRTAENDHVHELRTADGQDDHAVEDFPGQSADTGGTTATEVEFPTFKIVSGITRDEIGNFDIAPISSAANFVQPFETPGDGKDKSVSSDDRHDEVGVSTVSEVDHHRLHSSTVPIVSTSSTAAKRKVCRHYLQGRCSRKEKCRFQHPVPDSTEHPETEYSTSVSSERLRCNPADLPSTSPALLSGRRAGVISPTAAAPEPSSSTATFSDSALSGRRSGDVFPTAAESVSTSPKEPFSDSTVSGRRSGDVFATAAASVPMSSGEVGEESSGGAASGVLSSRSSLSGETADNDGSLILGNFGDIQDEQEYATGARTLLETFGATAETLVEVIRCNRSTGVILLARVKLPSAEQAWRAVEARNCFDFAKVNVTLRRPFAGDFDGSDSIAATDRRRGGGHGGGGRGRWGGRGRRGGRGRDGQRK